MDDNKEKIVFTNGCFDILHAGHIDLLKTIKEVFKDYTLIVGLNSDKSIRNLKGKDRPIISEQLRKLQLEAIRYVDGVIIFDEITPAELIQSIKPNVIVKGIDYINKTVVGQNVATQGIFIIKKKYKISTTDIINKIQRIKQEDHSLTTLQEISLNEMG